MKKIVILALLALAPAMVFAQKYSLSDPSGANCINITVGERVSYSVVHNGAEVIPASDIALTLTDGTVLGEAAKVVSKHNSSTQGTIAPLIYKKSVVENSYNELTLKMAAPKGRKGSYSIVWRAYPDGVAYRFVTALEGDYLVRGEKAEVNLPAGTQLIAAPIKGRIINGEENQWHTNFQNTYKSMPYNEWPADRQIMTPALAKVGNARLCITEVDLFNYPGMRLMTTESGLKGVYAAYPKDVKITTRGLKGEVYTREDYIAKLPGQSELPWRAIQIADHDTELLNSDFVYKLAKPAPADADWSWVKPGKVAWDWWNDWNIYGVDFRAGINNDTYKYYIDFASDYGIEYVILDEGWAVAGPADLFQVVPEINLEELVAYANQKNVGLILWAGFRAFDKDMERVCKHYADMGIKGFKIDFMDRDDQYMVDFNRRCAEMGAKYKMLIDLHGMYKPTGQQHTWPNSINFEGVYGLEEVKWEEPDFDMVTYDVTFPYIRLVAGPADYTQGAMRNATKANYYSVDTEPMSQGTRCRQLAEYVIFDSPLNMLCDNPSNYRRESECARFIASIPTVWADTKPLEGKIGEYIVTARQANDGSWYIGALTDWNARDLQLDLSFLPAGEWKAEIFQDGINADRAARDYKRITTTLSTGATAAQGSTAVSAAHPLQIHMAPAGGFVVHLTQQD